MTSSLVQPPQWVVAGLAQTVQVMGDVAVEAMVAAVRMETRLHSGGVAQGLRWLDG